MSAHNKINAKKHWQSPRGTEDIYGQNQWFMQEIIEQCCQVVNLFNYQKITTPIFEYSEVFKSSVGNTSDIVTKELYEFPDKKDRLMALRPEGTAGIVRAVIEHHLLTKPSFHKLYYYGPMFRYERPQKGRQRQFHQFGVENFAPKNYYVDFEVILIAHTILKRFKIATKLLINSLGGFATRNEFSKQLALYLQTYQHELSPASQKRLQSNPLRILDDKDDCQKIFMKDAPKINQFYSTEETQSLQAICQLLDEHMIDYEVRHDLVRGLDYYTDTIFEFVPIDGISSQQATLIAGGRYDKLMENLGGFANSGIGFAIGIERIMESLKTNNNYQLMHKDPLVYVANISQGHVPLVFEIVCELRRGGFRTEWNIKPQKLSKIFTKSAAFHPDAMIIIGDDEIAQNQVQVKIAQLKKQLARKEIVNYLQEYFASQRDIKK